MIMTDRSKHHRLIQTDEIRFPAILFYPSMPCKMAADSSDYPDQQYTK